MKKSTQTARVSPSKIINPLAKEVKEVFDGVYAQTQSFANNKTSAINGLIVSGDAGTGKTHTVKKALVDAKVTQHVEYLKGGKVTAASLYVKLYLNRQKHRILVMDDVEGRQHAERNQIIPMLLGACDLGQNREVTWETTRKNAMMEEYDVPHSFKFNGTIIWITNDRKEDILKKCKQWALAIDSRFNFATCRFTAEQKLMYTLYLCENIGMLNGACVDHKQANGKPGYPQKDIDAALEYINKYYRNLVEITPRIALRICDTFHYQPASVRNSILQQMWQS